jgi:hypothetical protein
MEEIKEDAKKNNTKVLMENKCVTSQL